MTESEWLAQLKAGDEVIIHTWRNADIHTVAKTTKTQITANGTRFNRHGRQIGSHSYWSQWLQQPTPEKREKVIVESELRSLTSRVRSLKENIKIPRDKDGLNKFIEALTPFC
jgi:hypothetical protein